MGPRKAGATALLDIPRERIVQAALQTVLADRTAVIIAPTVHRRDRGSRAGAAGAARSSKTAPPAEPLVGDGEYADLHSRWAVGLA